MSVPSAPCEEGLCRYTSQPRVAANPTAATQAVSVVSPTAAAAYTENGEGKIARNNVPARNL
eukprot:5752268-Pleurochrysis_carterae.AAC.1